MTENKSSRWTLVVNGALIGVTVGMLWWAIADYPARPDVWDRLHVGFWAIMLGIDLWILWADLRKRYRRRPARDDIDSWDWDAMGDDPRLPATSAGYVDCHGRTWKILEAVYGETYLSSEGVGTYLPEYVSQRWGPLTRIDG